MSKNIYKIMVEMQHKLNKKTAGEDYIEKDLNWNSCIIAESGELLGSFGYKWWKKQDVDMDNIKVEAIDLLHFVISESICSYSHKDYIDNTIDEFTEYFEEDDKYLDFKETSLDKLIDHLNYNNYDRLFIMKQIFTTLGMSNDDVYIAYIVKNCLNKFRQDNGYKEGTYKKDWNGVEDNVIAYTIAEEWGADEELFYHLSLDLDSYYKENVLA